MHSRLTLRLPLIAFTVLSLAGCTPTVPRVKRLASNVVLGNAARAAATVLSPVAGRKTRATLDGLNDKQQIGSFKGSARFEKLAPHLFWFEQPSNKADEFSFTSRLTLDKETGKVIPRPKPWKIVPKEMFFDGSSVPRSLWEVDSLGPFDFTLSALIHDWIFEAHHRHEIYKKAVESAEKGGEPEVAQFFKEMMAKYAEYSTTNMPLKEAGWIMAETIYREMLVAESQSKFLKGALSSDYLKKNPSIGNTEQGLIKLRDQVDIAKMRTHVLGYYRWAISSFIAKGVYDPKHKSSQPLQQSSHASTVTTIMALLDHANHGNQTREGVDPTQLISTTLLAAFRRVRDGHTREEAAILLREKPSSTAALRAATMRAKTGGALNEAAALEAASRLIQRYESRLRSEP